MASILVTGTIDAIHFRESSVIVIVLEPRVGWKRNDGSFVEPTTLEWRCIFKDGSKNYINNHFGKGNYVTIRGDIVPYVVDNGKLEEGFTILGKTIDMTAYPRNVRRERQMQKDSQLHASGVPNLEAYSINDFD